MDNQGLLEKSDITISFPSKPHRKNEDSGTPIPTLVGNLIVGVPIMRIMELVGVFDSFSYNEALHDLYVRTMVLTQKGTLSDAMKAGKYNCECISCGHTLSSDEHCANIKMP